MKNDPEPSRTDRQNSGGGNTKPVGLLSPWMEKSSYLRIFTLGSQNSLDIKTFSSSIPRQGSFLHPKNTEISFFNPSIETSLSSLTLLGNSSSFINTFNPKKKSSEITLNDYCFFSDSQSLNGEIVSNQRNVFIFSRTRKSLLHRIRFHTNSYTTQIQFYLLLRSRSRFFQEH